MNTEYFKFIVKNHEWNFFNTILMEKIFDSFIEILMYRLEEAHENALQFFAHNTENMCTSTVYS